MHPTLYETYYHQILKYNLLYKYQYTNFYTLPNVHKIIIFNKSTKFLDLLSLLSLFIFFEILTTQRPFLIFTKKIKVHGTLKNGTLIGCKLTLQNHILYHFLSLFTIKYFPKLINKKQINISSKKLLINTYSINFNELTILPHYEKFYYLFNKINNITITYLCTQHISYLTFLTLIYLPIK